MVPTVEDIVAIVMVQLGKSAVNKDDHLVEVLGAASADILNIVVAAEERYNVEIDETELGSFTTASGLHDLIVQRLSSKT